MVWRLPLDQKSVLFESFMGRTYSDSSRAIFERMRADARFDGYTFYWAFKDPGRAQTQLAALHPELRGVTFVTYGSKEFDRAAAVSGYWVTNSRMPEYLQPRQGQVYLQCWHGTPIKRLARDIQIETANVMNSSRELAERYRFDASRYTYMVSPSPYATEKFTSAFSLDLLGKQDAILEVGYPRNDRLADPDAAEVAAIKDRLGIPQDKKVMLWAPTWRDDQHETGKGYTLSLEMDFDALRERLGDEWVILFRAHYFIVSQFDFSQQEGFVWNVGGVDDVNDLYLVADALVTDYSSVMFDYANLRRPMVFYMYDLVQYRERLRGFYFDFSELPGPIVHTIDDFISAVENMPSYWDQYQEQYRAFNEKFTPLDDGHASDRVIERVFAPAGINAATPVAAKEALS